MHEWNSDLKFDEYCFLLETEEDGNVSEEVSLMDVDKERDSFESKSDDEDSETSAILSQIQVSFLDGFPVKIVEGPIKTGKNFRIHIFFI